MSSRPQRKRKLPARVEEATAVPQKVPSQVHAPSLEDIVTAVTPAVTEGVVKTLLQMGVIAQPTIAQPPPAGVDDVQIQALADQVVIQPAPVSLALPLGLGLDPKLKAKIWADEFVDFALLLPTASSSSTQMKVVEGPDGSFVIKKASAPSAITTIDMWFEAFLIFAALYTERQPSASAKIMKHASIVKDLAKQAGDAAGLFYDAQFRKLRELLGESLPFEISHSETYSQALAMGLFRASKASMQHKSGNVSKSKRKTCNDFNSGSCFRKTCTFPHLCKLCFGPHTIQQCVKATATNNIAKTTSNKPRSGARS